MVCIGTVTSVVMGKAKGSWESLIRGEDMSTTDNHFLLNGKKTTNINLIHNTHSIDDNYSYNKYYTVAVTISVNWWED